MFASGHAPRRSGEVPYGGSLGPNQKGVSFMLTITETAADALETIVDSIPDAPETTGLRIAHGVGSDGQPGLTLELASAPAPDDQVVDGRAVPVFLDPELAEELDDKVLDAQPQGDRFAFVLAEQA